MSLHTNIRIQRTNPHRIPTIKISLDQLIKSTLANISQQATPILQSRIPQSNSIMLEYIKSIYDVYKIQDPLEDTLGKKKRKNKLSVSEQKIMRMKRQTKNYTPSKEKQLSSTASIKNRIMNSTEHRNYLTSKGRGGNDDHPNNNSTHDQSYFAQKSNRHSLNPVSMEVQPIFRYCFMCQHPILEANIMIHQSRCSEFKKLYDIPVQEISFLLMEKINRLKAEISTLVSEKSTLIKEQQQRRIKESVKEWLGNIDENLGQLEFGLKYQRLYESMLESISNSTYTLLDLTKKLKWFIKIREQLRSKFNV